MDSNSFFIKITTTKPRKYARAKDCWRCMVQNCPYKINKVLNTMTTLKMFYEGKWIDTMVYFDKDENLCEYIIYRDSVNIFKKHEFEIKINKV